VSKNRKWDKASGPWVKYHMEWTQENILRPSLQHNVEFSKAKWLQLLSRKLTLAIKESVKDDEHILSSRHHG